MYKMYLQKCTFLFCNYVHFMLAKNTIDNNDPTYKEVLKEINQIEQDRKSVV